MIDDHFTRQLGLVTRAQALTAGVSRRQLQGLVARGDWRPVHTGVYRHAAAPVTVDQARLAAVLAAGPGAAVSHRAAVAAHGLRGFDARLVEVSRPTRAPLRLVGALVHRTPDLTTDLVQRVGPVPVTTPERTLIDLGTVMPARFVARCVDAWLADKKTSIDRLRAALDAHAGRGRSGVGVLRGALERRRLGTAEPDSEAEAMLGRLLIEAGLPPVHHYLVRVGDRVFAELDWAYPDRLVALELDGYGVHLMSEEIFDGDRFRHNELEILGWHVLHFSSRQVRRSPDVVVRQVRAMVQLTSGP